MDTQSTNMTSNRFIIFDKSAYGTRRIRELFNASGYDWHTWLAAQGGVLTIPQELVVSEPEAVSMLDKVA